MSRDSVATVRTIEESDIPAKNLPQPVGWRMLVRPVEIAEQTEAGIQLVQQTVEEDQYLRYYGQVLRMGDSCYQHPKFLKGDAWCSVGDWVTFLQHAGQRIRVHDNNGEKVELRILNDDEVLTVSADPNVLAM